MGEKIFKHTSEKGIISSICNEFSDSKFKNSNWKIAENHEQIRKCHITTPKKMIFHYILTIMAKIKIVMIPKYRQRCNSAGSPIYCW